MGHMKKSELPERLEFARTHLKREFAERYGIEIEAARTFYRKQGIECAREGRIDWRVLPEMLKDKKPAECAKALGASLPSVYKQMKELGIPTNPAWRKRRGKEQGERDAMVMWLSERFSDASIARLIGVSRERVRQIVLKCGGE